MVMSLSLSRDRCLRILKSVCVPDFVTDPTFAGFCFHLYNGDASFGIDMEEGSYQRVHVSSLDW